MTRTTSKNQRILTPVLLTLALAACEKQPASGPAASNTPPAQSAPAATTPATTPAEGGASMSVMGVAFAVPEGWSQAAPSNSMRLAELHAPGGASPCVAVFSTAGGGVEPNISRWVMQMQDAGGQPLPMPEIQTEQVGGLTVHTVEMTGTYLGMGRTPPEPDTTMKAAIVETPTGLLFIKMTGPTADMANLADAWNALVASAHAG